MILAFMLASICLHKQISLQSDKEDLNSKIDSADLMYSGKEFQSSGACSMRKITLYNFHSSWCGVENSEHREDRSVRVGHLSSIIL